MIGRITIPRLHLSAIVREGDDQDTLSIAVGHIPGTALPGQNGNVVLAGHRDTLFLGLKGIRDNDEVRLETLAGDHVYRVKSTEIVQPRDVSVLNPTAHSELTLVTCYPFNYIGSAPDRFIVKATEVKASEVSEKAVSENAPAPQPRLESVKLIEKPRATEPEIPDPHRIAFDIGAHHSRALAPGISLGIDGTNAQDHTVRGWLWLMPDRRTIWLRDKRVHDPLVFYDDRDGMRREVVITGVTNDSATGYLLMTEE